MGDQHAAGLRYRANEGLRIQRLKAARIDDLDFDAFGGQCFGGFQGAGNHNGIGYKGQVAALALDLSRLKGD